MNQKGGRSLVMATLVQSFKDLKSKNHLTKLSAREFLYSSEAVDFAAWANYDQQLLEWQELQND